MASTTSASPSFVGEGAADEPGGGCESFDGSPPPPSCWTKGIIGRGGCVAAVASTTPGATRFLRLENQEITYVIPKTAIATIASRTMDDMLPNRPFFAAHTLVGVVVGIVIVCVAENVCERIRGSLLHCSHMISSHMDALRVTHLQLDTQHKLAVGFELRDRTER